MKTSTENPIVKLMKGRWGVFLGYSLLSILMTYPLILKLNKVLMVKINVIPGGDANLYLWYMWWTKKALLNFQNPFYTDMLFYPTGASLCWSELSMLNMLMSLPLQFLYSVITIHNMLYLLSFILAGWGAYLLLVYLTKDKAASFIGGCIFAFTPFHFVRDSQLCYLSIQWIPFFILYFLKFFEARRIKDALLAGIFLACAALSALYYMVFALFFVLLFLIYKLARERKLVLNKNYVTCFATFILVFGFLVSPVLGPMMVENIEHGGNVSSLDISVICSADLAAFFVPSPLHPFFKKAVMPFYERIWTYNGERFGNNVISTVFLGYFVIFLLVYNIRVARHKDKRFWWFVCLSFCGPYHIHRVIRQESIQTHG